MSASPSAVPSGTFNIGGTIPVHRLGYGAMRITGPGIWDQPKDRSEALRVLRRLPELDVNFIDTADSYGPFVSEDLIGEALAPLPGMMIATKGGLLRTGPDVWIPLGKPDYLRQCVVMSLRRLKQEQIGLWQLHRIDPTVPRDEQFGAIAEMIGEGLIAHAGLSECSVEDIQAAQKIFSVATVQNLYNLANRGSEAVLDYCEREGIGFIPWFPLAAGDLARPGGVLDTLARKIGVTPSQVALAWVLKRSPVMLPIPGTSQVAHLEENVGAARISLSDEDFAALERQARPSSQRVEARKP
jgi:pyridoxine 4-dehydrogenase